MDAPEGSSPPESLTNKRKRGRERSRVTRACDRCKRRKVRCSGVYPCEQCGQAVASCTYDASYTRGRDPVMTMPGLANRRDSEVNRRTSILSEAAESILDERGKQDIGTPDRLLSGDQDDNRVLVSPSPEVARNPPPQNSTSSRVSPEPAQTDLQGHYVGPSSGVSFLLRVQKRFHKAVSFSQASSIFTFGDAPLPEADPAFCLLIPREAAQKLLARYFNFAVPTYRFLHQPTVQSWLDEFFDTKGIMYSKEDAPARKAVLFMAFAQATEYMPEVHPEIYGDASSNVNSEDIMHQANHLATSESARYFIAAEQQLSKERGTIRLTSIQARLAQCFYLLSQSRINHCWSLFGTTTHLALAIGLNRNRRAHPNNEMNRVEVEARRRTFWCAYILDNYLSGALGRPRTFHDEDIDQEPPSIIEDADLVQDDSLPRRQVRGQSLMLALVAHVSISRIVGKILRDLYSIRPISNSTRATLTAQHTESLKNWRAEISYFLDAEEKHAALLQPIYQRQRNVLNHAYWHAIILTNRPFLLSNFARLQHHESTSLRQNRGDQSEVSVQECLKAAMSMAEAVDSLFHAGMMFRAYWFTTYFTFSAVVVLYVYVIQQKASPVSMYQKYLEMANKCQTHMSSIAAQGSLTQRYCVVLEELRREALRQTTSIDSAISAGQQQLREEMSHASAQETTNLGVGEGVLDSSSSFPDMSMSGDFIWNESPSSSLADMTSWGYFDSMVTSGFSGLANLLTNDGTSFL